MEALGRMAAVILAVILLFLFPIRYEAQKTDLSMNSYVETQIDYLFNLMCSRHELSKEMYADFCNQLSTTGNSYQIDIERYSEVIYSDESNESYMEYEDLLHELKSVDYILLNQSDYLLIRVCKQKISVIDRIKNIFLPTSNRSSVYVVGGCID